MTTVLVTGATDGLGRAVAGDLAAAGHAECSCTAAAPSAPQAVAQEIGAAGVHLADFFLAGRRCARSPGRSRTSTCWSNNAGLISEQAPGSPKTVSS